MQLTMFRITPNIVLSASPVSKESMSEGIDQISTVLPRICFINAQRGFLVKGTWLDRQRTGKAKVLMLP
ncbi:hypothetical protein NQU17_09835 [Clostridiaceae bacterium HFYG-1003]|nr:hypothetical protein NQU17_09835 [Clostridiaceae bacterium HFYG-1003]